VHPDHGGTPGDLGILRSLDPRLRHELAAVGQVEGLGPHLRSVDVVQHDVPGNPPDQAGVCQRGTHRPGAND